MTRATDRITRTADLAGTFVFAVEGALTAIGAGLDPVGVIALSFLTALGGGVIRDLLIGATPVAAVADWHYAVIVLAASAATWLLYPFTSHIPPGLMLSLDAAGLALFAVAGTEKALDRGIHPLVAAFLGTVSGVGGGTLRDVFINQVPHVLRVDIYASAAFVAALVIVLGRAAKMPARTIAIVAGLLCIALRLTAVAYGWQLPARMVMPGK